MGQCVDGNYKGVTCYNFEKDKDIIELIKHRDNCALDWYGEDLIYHIIHVINTFDGIDGEYKAAQKRFNNLPYDLQFKYVEYVIKNEYPNSNYSYR